MGVSKTSVIIPARNEVLLQNTVNNLRKNAEGELEIIVVLDGSSNTPLPEKVKIIKKNNPKGIRAAIDSASEIVTGDYVLRIDGHCAMGQGWDKILQENCDDDWLITPRRYYLNTETFKPMIDEVNPKIGIVDYYYLSCPWTHPDYPGLLISFPWFRRTREKKEILIDETMSIQGSIWYCKKKFFKDRLSDLSSLCPGFGDQTHVPMRVWMSGGKVMVNKKTWYAHPPPKNANYIRGYKLILDQVYSDNLLESDFWINNKWEKRIHDFDWIVDKFWPLPQKDNRVSGEKYLWPENWKEFYNMTQLCKLAYKYRSDKCPPIKHHYTPVYYDLFKDKTETVKKVLEIGIGYPETMEDSKYKTGASLYMWRDFFPNAEIWGADVKTDLLFNEGRIRTLQCDQRKKSDLENMLNIIGTDIDLVIDDGSHNPADQVFTCKTLIPLLKMGVVYVIEDVGDLGILEQLGDFECQYNRFKNKKYWDDRMIIIRHK